MPDVTPRKELPVVAALCSLVAVVIAFWVGIGYVIVHFVVKFW